MPYTAAQLTAYYTALTGIPAASIPTSDALVISAISTQNLQGSATDQATLSTLFHLNAVQGTFDVAESTYQFFTGASVTAAGLASLEATLNSTTAVNGTNYSLFNTENRYYNFAVNLASAGGAGNASFVANYGTLTVAQTISTAYEAIVGSSNVGTAAAQAAIADITSRLAFFQSVAVSRAGGIDAGGVTGQNIALKAIIVGYILEEANKADVGTYAKALDQLAASVSAGNAIGNTNLLTTYAPGGAGYNTGVGNTTTSLGQTFALTTGTDAITATAGNATFVGFVNTTTPTLSTLTAQDVINATGANNTLSVTYQGGAGEASGNALVNGVQTVQVRDVDATGAGAATFNASRTAGVGTLTSYLSSGDVTFTNVAGSTAVSDYGNGSLVTGVLTANYVSGTTEALLLQNGTNGGGVVLNNTTGGDTVTVTSAGSLNTLGSLTMNNSVTTLNVVANSQFTAGATVVTAGGAASTIGTLNVSGTALTTLGATAAGVGFSVNTINETGTGGLTATILGTAANAGAVRVTGSTAVDSITLTGPVAATTNVNTSGSGGGAIGDTITVTGTVAAGASLNGGGGATLATPGATFLAINGFTAANRALITGFSTIGVTDALVQGNTYDINTVGAQNFTTAGVAAGGAIGFANGLFTSGAATVNTPTGTIVTFTGAINANTGGLNISEAGALTNTSDTLTLGYTGQGTAVANNSTLSQIAAPGVETVQVIANRAAGAAASSQLVTSITDAVAKTITFAGNENIVFNTNIAVSAGPYVAYAQLGSISGVNATGSLNIDVQTLTTSTLANPLSITLGSGVNTVNTGNYDRVTEGTANNLLNVGVVANANTYSSLLDAHAGDRVSFTNAAAVNATKIVLPTTAVYQDYLNAAIQQGGAGQVSIFDFGGNSYLVENNSGNGFGGFSNGTDTVVQLVGIHTISGTIGAAVAAVGSASGSFGGVVSLTS